MDIFGFHGSEWVNVRPFRIVLQVTVIHNNQICCCILKGMMSGLNLIRFLDGEADKPENEVAVLTECRSQVPRAHLSQ